MYSITRSALNQVDTAYDVVGRGIPALRPGDDVEPIASAMETIAKAIQPYGHAHHDRLGRSIVASIHALEGNDFSLNVKREALDRVTTAVNMLRMNAAIHRTA